MAMVDEDSQLLAAYARNRDPAAFQRLVDRHVHFVYAAALRQIRDRQLAEDILQAVFLLLSQKAAELRPGTLVKGWLFHATRYAANNVRRAEARRVRREREAAAMRLQTTPEKDSEDIGPYLDDALANLSTKDRTVLLMRYFEEMPLAVVGQAMGISEHAAKKRVARALERLRDHLLRNGVGVTDGALPGALAISVAETAPASAIKAAIDLVIHNAAVHSGSAVPLAKGVSKMMTQNKLKLVTIKCVLAIACVGAGAAVVVQETRSPGSLSSVILADEAPAAVAPAAPSIEMDYQSCQKTLETLIDSYDKLDAASAKSQIYFGPDANSPVAKIVPALLDVDLAVYRLQKDAVARFGVHAMGLNTFWTPSALLMRDLMERIDIANCQRKGEEIVIAPAERTFGSDGFGPHAPLYFRNVDGVFKLDYGRTFRTDFHVRRRHPVPGESREDALCAGEKIFIDGFNVVSDDLENGKIADVGKLQERIYGVMLDLTREFPDISVDSRPR